MGICSSKRPDSKVKGYGLPRDLESKFHQIELELLKLIYDDLASRTAESRMNKTCFTDFFTMIGLWGQLVFDYFDLGVTNQLTFEHFIRGVEFFVKCDYDKKIEHLFRIYDLNHQGTVSKSEFHQLILNYPREDLIQLLDDSAFLLEEHILDYHKRKQKQTQQKNNPRKANDQQLDEQVHAIMERRNSRRASMLSQSSHSSEQGMSIRDTLPIKEQSVQMMFPNDSMIGPNGVPMGQCGQTIVFNVNGKQVELKRVNINYLVQKYVDMIYKGKSAEESNLSIEEFKQFVHKHPKIFKGLYKSFNYDVWGIDEATQVPRMVTAQKDLDGIIYKVSRKVPKRLRPRYFKLIQSFCLSFKSKVNPLPSRIFCLDGLTVQEIMDDKAQIYGFEISHKDKIYQTRTYRCQSFEDYKQWTTSLQSFQKASVNDYYSILQKIGEGKFSIVYLCEAKKKDRDQVGGEREQMAIKIIEKFKLSKTEKYMLAHEVEIMKLLNHSCIIKLHEIIETKTHLNIITELVKDGDLFDYIIKSDLLCEQEASLIMSQLLDTVNYIHTVGIVHRDLKPENIMIVLDPVKQTVKQVKLIDFGFANFITNIQNKEEALCGTTNYLAPESLEQKKITFKVDNFALGVILYFLLSGYLPFDSEFPEDIIKNIIDCNYNLEDDFWDQISAEAKDLIRKLLMKEPTDRISTKDALNHPWIVNRTSLPTTKAKKPKRLVLF